MKEAKRVCLIALGCAALFGAGCNEIAAPSLEGEWYKGDLHCHSTHSDGDSSVQEVIASAESKGLDFFVITDHDGSMDGSPTQWYDPDYHSDQMVMLYGVEWHPGIRRDVVYFVNFLRAHTTSTKGENMIFNPFEQGARP